MAAPAPTPATDPSGTPDHLSFLPDMQRIDPRVREAVLAAKDAFDPARYSAQDVRCALAASVRGPEQFAALLSPAAAPFLEEMAQAAQSEKRRF
ncbi:MAG: 2-iminoacetate synthase ThiH, partial [Raoultibacter sp.]